MEIQAVSDRKLYSLEEDQEVRGSGGSPDQDTESELYPSRVDGGGVVVIFDMTMVQGAVQSGRSSGGQETRRIS